MLADNSVYHDVFRTERAFSPVIHPCFVGGNQQGAEQSDGKQEEREDDPCFIRVALAFRNARWNLTEKYRHANHNHHNKHDNPCIRGRAILHPAKRRGFTKIVPCHVLYDLLPTVVLRNQFSYQLKTRSLRPSWSPLSTTCELASCRFRLRKPWNL
jgi:hypothetical protein